MKIRRRDGVPVPEGDVLVLEAAGASAPDASIGPELEVERLSAVAASAAGSSPGAASAHGHNHGGGAASRDFGQERVAVETLARQREEQIPRCHPARIGAETRDAARGRAVDQLAFHDVRDIFQCTRFHNFIGAPRRWRRRSMFAPPRA